MISLVKLKVSIVKMFSNNVTDICMAINNNNKEHPQNKTHILRRNLEKQNVH